MRPFRERKADRVAHYWRWVHGWRQRACGACNGSGYYDYDHHGSPLCGACEGTGRETYPGPKSEHYQEADQ